MVVTLEDLRELEQKKLGELSAKERGLKEKRQNIISSFDQKIAQEKAIQAELRKKAGGLTSVPEQNTAPRIRVALRNIENSLASPRKRQRLGIRNNFQAQQFINQKKREFMQTTGKRIQEQFRAAKQLQERRGIRGGRRVDGTLDRLQQQRQDALEQLNTPERQIQSERQKISALNLSSIDDPQDLQKSIETAVELKGDASRDFLKLILPQEKHRQIDKLYAIERTPVSEFGGGSEKNRARNKAKFLLLEKGNAADFQKIIEQEERDRAISQRQSASIKTAKSNIERDVEKDIFERTGKKVDVNLDVGNTKFTLFGFTPESKNVIDFARIPAKQAAKKTITTKGSLIPTPTEERSIPTPTEERSIPTPTEERSIPTPEPILRIPDAQTLSKQTGFDISKQLSKTKSRFGLDLKITDIINQRGELLPEAKSVFQKNLQVEKLLQERNPVGPETVTLGANTDFDTLFERRKSIVGQQKKRIKDIEGIDDDVQKITAFEQDLPLFKQRADEIDVLIDSLKQRESSLRETRKPQPLLSGAPKSFEIKDLVERRNTLAKLRNQKLDEFEKISDPAKRRVTIEQDIPQFDERIFKIDKDIERGIDFAESRDPLKIGIQNQQVKGRGRLPKFFEVQVGDDTKKFRRTRRGARRAEQFFATQKAEKLTELEKIEDPVKKAIAKEQDLFALDVADKVTKQQKKALKAEKRQELEAQNIGGAAGSLGFLPFTPSDTPTGKLRIPSPPRGGSSNIMTHIQSLGDIGIQPRSRGGKRSGSADLGNGFDIGAVFGTSEKIPHKQKGEFDFF